MNYKDQIFSLILIFRTNEAAPVDVVVALAAAAAVVGAAFALVGAAAVSVGAAAVAVGSVAVVGAAVVEGSVRIGISVSSKSSTKFSSSGIQPSLSYPISNNNLDEDSTLNDGNSILDPDNDYDDISIMRRARLLLFGL